jgi:NADH-quinone oxidoreductase subunit N
MTATDLLALVPFMMITAVIFGVLGVITFRRQHSAVAAMTLIGLTATIATLPLAATVIPHHMTSLLILDRYGLLYLALLLLTSGVVAILAYGYLAGREGPCEEFYLLLLLATLGSMVLVTSQHFAALFLGLELLSVALYTLLAYLRTDMRPLEAGVKYLILAATSSALLLLGMAFIYAELGTMALARMTSLLVAGNARPSALVLMGMALLLTGLGFKLAVVPFHMWTPDVYEGAPAPVTAFVATVSKGAIVALLLRYVMQGDAAMDDAMLLVFSLIAIASMVVGNLLALWQQNVKRILAYSSIAHLGYLLVALIVGGERAAETATFYVVAYVVTTLCAFGVVTMLSDKDEDANTMEAYRGLFWRHPGLAVVFTVALFSLAGVPLTAGFFGKFYILAAGVASALWVPVGFLVVTSALGLFYYLRIVVTLYAPLAQEDSVPPSWPAPSWSWGGGVALAALTLLLVWLGVYPAPLLSMIRVTVVSLL